MKSFYTASFLALAALVIASSASAASLGLSTEDPSLSASDASISYLEILSDGDLSTFGAAVDALSGATPDGPAFIGLGIGFPLADPTTGASGGFDIFDDSGLFLAGDLEEIGFAEGVIELAFGNLSGAAAPAFGAQVLLVLTFTDLPGPNPFDQLLNGSLLHASITIASVSDAVVVPVPASLPLVLSALAALGLFATTGLARSTPSSV